MNEQTLRLAALEAAIEAGGEMAEELRSLAADMAESSGDAAEAAWIYELISRWDNAVKVLTHA